MCADLFSDYKNAIYYCIYPNWGLSFVHLVKQWKYLENNQCCRFFSFQLEEGDLIFFFWCMFNLQHHVGQSTLQDEEFSPLREVTWLSSLSCMFLQFLFQLQKLFSQHTSASSWCTEYPRKQSIFFYREVIYDYYFLTWFYNCLSIAHAV